MKKYIVSFAVATLVLSSVTGCIEEYSPEGYNNYVTIDQAAEAPGSYDNFVNNITTSLSGQCCQQNNSIGIPGQYTV